MHRTDRMWVTKALFVNSSVINFFFFVKSPVTFFQSCWYLAGVTTAQLWWQLSNINMIISGNPVLYDNTKWWKYHIGANWFSDDQPPWLLVCFIECLEEECPYYTVVQWHYVAFVRIIRTLNCISNHTPHFNEVEWGYTGFTLSVCPSVHRMVSAHFLQQYFVRSNSYLHILSRNFRWFVAFKDCFKINKFEILANS